MPDESLVLVADIGATNFRFALMTARGGPPTIVARDACGSAEHPQVALAAFLTACAARPRAAAIGVAGPVRDGRARLTNTPWSIEAAGLAEVLGVERVVLINDLAAQAWGVLAAPAASFKPIGRAPGALVGTTAVIGPGTGLGVARLEVGAADPAIATEGGHVGFAPNDEVEAELARLWRREIGRVTNEHVVSGPGMARLHRGLALLAGVDAPALEGPEIVRRALSGTDAGWLATVKRFAAILGAVAGDIALAQGAQGVALTGAIVKSIAPVLETGDFRARFETRGPNARFLADAPTWVVTEPDLGLFGAYALLAAKTLR